MINPYIYAIKGNGMTYYGSSRQPICERKSTHVTQHRHHNKTQKHGLCRSYLILDACNDWTLEIVEELPIETTKEELLLRENYYIKNFECINANQAIQTEEDLREYKRIWSEKDRREKGIQPRPILTEEEKDEKQKQKRIETNIKRNEKYANMDEQEKQTHLEHKRELWSKREKTEEQKERARERARQQRERIKNDPTKLQELKDYKKKWAEENKEKLVEKNKTTYEERKEIIKTTNANYYKENKEAINEKRRLKYQAKKLESDSTQLTIN